MLCNKDLDLAQLRATLERQRPRSLNGSTAVLLIRSLHCVEGRS